VIPYELIEMTNQVSEKSWHWEPQRVVLIIICQLIKLLNLLVSEVILIDVNFLVTQVNQRP
jgi:hypothetical protein